MLVTESNKTTTHTNLLVLFKKNTAYFTSKAASNYFWVKTKNCSLALSLFLSPMHSLTHTPHTPTHTHHTHAHSAIKVSASHFNFPAIL